MCCCKLYFIRILFIFLGILPLSQATSAQNAYYNVREGQKLIRDGQFVEALEMMNLAIHERPFRP